ncbi:hypothetical protein Patl1_22941 [Pistacia atlantica]|uniref:Uncharacterized protein n=1 Tax=Pistacia atlantica TaxID=434234 RepID=A0ACC0ZVY2_9ROSI|nr:hypothetical protein Patl1_22941 [Pistacia atlantica]
MSLGGLETWNSSTDCCQWNRVRCHSRSSSQEVTGLDLYSLLPSVALNTSFSEIPGTGFSNLSNLVYLDMWQNSFNGSIPPQLLHLRHLEYLDLSNNLIEGTISNDVVGLKSLKQLILDENFIRGEIPAGIGNLTELHKLSLRGNKFSGMDTIVSVATEGARNTGPGEQCTVWRDSK